MDLDAYGSVHRGQWDELDALSRSRPTNGAEVDRFLSLYQSGATDLARIRQAAPRSTTGDRLSLTLFRARLPA